MPTTTVDNPYARLGVRTFINADGANTIEGGSLMRPEVLEAITRAGRHFVMMADLHEAVGRRIAELCGCQAATVTSGCAGSLLLAGAACLTGQDQEKVLALPDTGGRPNQFLVSAVDQHSYIPQGFHALGATVQKVGSKTEVTAKDFAAAITERTAALVYFVGRQSAEELPAVVKLAHARGLPVIVDAAGQLPPRSNLRDLPATGADLVCISGGKGLRGPQCTGLILGTEEHVLAARMNGSPNRSIGRGMKVGKEEIMGLLAALELFVSEDEAALEAQARARLQHIADALEGIPGVLATFDSPENDYYFPTHMALYVKLDPSFPLTPAELKDRLYEGDPAVLAKDYKVSVRIRSGLLEDGEAEIIATRLREVLTSV